MDLNYTDDSHKQNIEKTKADADDYMLCNPFTNAIKSKFTNHGEVERGSPSQ